MWHLGSSLGIRYLPGSGSSQKLLNRLLWLVRLQTYKCDVHGDGYRIVVQALSPECDNSALFGILART